MKIGLIALSGVRVRTGELRALGVTLPGFVRRGEVIASLPSLGLLTVAALTPAGHDVAYLEYDRLPDFAALPAFDLVGISALSARIGAAYALADAYRARGTRVVLGGLHVSALPDEAAAHADAVVVGAAEGAWPSVVADAALGALRARYAGARSGVFEPPLYARPRFELLAQGERAYNRVTVQATRGCPRRCAFCAASLRIHDGYERKPVARVVDELRAARDAVKLPFVELADDNTFLDAAWSKQLLRALAREEIRYFTEADASVADDPELCDLLAASGCRQVLVGFESPRAGDLAGLDPSDWKRAQAPRIRRVADELQGRGVSVNGCFMLGLDGQTPEVFPELLAFVRASGLAEVQYTVLTPFPGTPLYARLRAEGRLLAERFWERCTLFDVNFRPSHMTVEELESGMRWLFLETYGAGESAGRRRRFLARARVGDACSGE